MGNLRLYTCLIVLTMFLTGCAGGGASFGTVLLEFEEAAAEYALCSEGPILLAPWEEEGLSQASLDQIERLNLAGIDFCGWR